MKRRSLIKAPSAALLDRIYKDAVRAVPGRKRISGLQDYLRRVHVEYVRLLELAGVYVEYAGLPETQTEAWRARDRTDENQEISWLRRLV